MSFFIVLAIFFAAYWFWRKSNEEKQKQVSDPHALSEQAASYEQKVDALMHQVADQAARIEMLEEKLRKLELN